MRERVTVVTLSVCYSVCHFFILEKAPFSVLNLHQYILGDNLNVALLSYFGEKASGTSAVTVVIYMGTAQSVNGLACELLAHEVLARGTFYQSCQRSSCGGFFPSRSCRLAAGAERD